MYLRIPNFLNSESLKLVDELIEGGQFTDGTVTTGGPTKSVKKNLQIDFSGHPQRDQFLQIITATVNSDSMMRSAVLPRRMTYPLLSKYETGMSYGWHIDNPIMSSMGNPVRTDIACTVFISNSADYQGGELVVRSSSGDVRVKFDRGDAFIYPATSYQLPVGIRYWRSRVGKGWRWCFGFKAWWQTRANARYCTTSASPMTES